MLLPYYKDSRRSLNVGDYRTYVRQWSFRCRALWQKKTLRGRRRPVEAEARPEVTDFAQQLLPISTLRIGTASGSVAGDASDSNGKGPKRGLFYSMVCWNEILVGKEGLEPPTSCL
jgi:hypothetical protein